MESNQRRWRVFGYDSFSACSEPDEPDAGHYPLGEFDTEEAARIQARKHVRWPRPGETTDAVFVVDPEGRPWRCLLDSCPDCQAPDAMKRTGRAKRGFPRLVRRFELKCAHCDRLEWRAEREHAFVPWQW